MEDNIIYFWTGSSLSDRYRKNLARTKAMNPSHQIYLVDDEQALEMLKQVHPKMAELYPKIIIPAARSDIARLVALYLYGGWYLDFDTLLKTGVKFLEYPDKSLFLQRLVADNKKGTIPNSPIGGRKAHPFFLAAIEYIWQSLSQKFDHYSVYNATGPNAILASAGPFLRMEETHWVDVDHTYLDVVPDQTKGSWTYQESCGIWFDADNPLLFQCSKNLERTGRLEALEYFAEQFVKSPRSLKHNIRVFTDKLLEHYLVKHAARDRLRDFYNHLFEMGFATDDDAAEIKMILLNRGFSLD